MIKKILSILIFSCYLQAGLVNSIAVIVNENVITLYDIDMMVSKKNISRNEAVSILIDEMLREQEISKYNIAVSKEDIAGYIEQIAQSNKMTTSEFKIALKKQNQNFDDVVSDITKRLYNQQLAQKIARGNLQSANEEDMKLYYDNNIEKFKTSKDSIQVVAFEKVKEKIFQTIMIKREQDYLKEYFETLKITADIKIVK